MQKFPRVATQSWLCSFKPITIHKQALCQWSTVLRYVMQIGIEILVQFAQLTILIKILCSCLLPKKINSA